MLRSDRHLGVAGLVAAVLFGAVFTGGPLPLVQASARADQAAGRVLFHEKGCEHCHGVDGAGGEKGPSLAGVGRKLKPDAVEQQILHGGDAMPAFADVLTQDEVKQLVEYLSTKKKADKTGKPTEQKPATPPANTGGSDDQ